MPQPEPGGGDTLLERIAEKHQHDYRHNIGEILETVWPDDWQTRLVDLMINEALDADDPAPAVMEFRDELMELWIQHKYNQALMGE